MPVYRLAGRNFSLPYSLLELKPFEMPNVLPDPAQFLPDLYSFSLISHTEGWVGGSSRRVEVLISSMGYLLKIVDGCGFFISSDGKTITAIESQPEVNPLGRETLLGPVLVFALALQNIWCLHASAVLYKESLIAIAGESGYGKSTLAAYLSLCPGWRLAADDILPVQLTADGLIASPRFPQLKLPADSQPSVGFPEQVSLKNIVLLERHGGADVSGLVTLAPAQAVQCFLAHIAGTRMFGEYLLERHLYFSSQAAQQVATYRLPYPHHREALPKIRKYLEEIC